MKAINEQDLSPNVGYKMYFSENEETERDPAQKPNTGDWEDERDENNTDREQNRGNDNSGGAGSTGSASTNS